jgi:predicted DNA-binding ribbon-helix-helix protein
MTTNFPSRFYRQQSDEEVRSIDLANMTSLGLPQEIWSNLDEIAAREDQSVASLLTDLHHRVELQMTMNSGICDISESVLVSAVYIFVVSYFRCASDCSSATTSGIFEKAIDGVFPLPLVM